MLLIIYFTCLLVVLSTQSDPPKYLDGGMGYLARKLNKKILAPTESISMSDPPNHINQPTKPNLEAIPVSYYENSPAPQLTPFKSQEPLIVLPFNTVINTDTSPEPEITQFTTTETTISDSIKEPSVSMMNVMPKEPAAVSTSSPSYFYDAFPISKELPVAVSRSRQRYPEIVYRVVEPYVISAPITEISPEIFAETQETTSSSTTSTTSTTTTTTTTALPTTQVSTTTAVPITSTSSPSCVNGEIYPTDTGSCDQILMCYNSVVVLLICPQGMGFNIETNHCDWSQYVPACNTQGI